MLEGYKTYILGAVTIIGAIASYLVGDTSLQAALQIAIPAALAMTVRRGVQTRK